MHRKIQMQIKKNKNRKKERREREKARERKEEARVLQLFLCMSPNPKYSIPFFPLFFTASHSPSSTQPSSFPTPCFLLFYFIYFIPVLVLFLPWPSAIQIAFFTLPFNFLDFYHYSHLFVIMSFTTKRVLPNYLLFDLETTF